jgi:acetamidase/formamidase
VHWGYFDPSIGPSLKIKSGDLSRPRPSPRRTPELMMDETVTRLFKEIPEEDRNPGVHIMSGPFWVEGAQPGDMLRKRAVRLRLPGQVPRPWHRHQLPVCDRQDALKGIRVPARPHLGTAGVAPAIDGRTCTIPPSLQDGNIDNWRIGAGATMYYPVQVGGALFSIGAPHVSQGRRRDFRHRDSGLAQRPNADRSPQGFRGHRPAA